jgi:hypothetical protein
MIVRRGFGSTSSRARRNGVCACAASEGEAKFWIDPTVELHANYGLMAKRVAEAQTLVEEHVEHVNEIRDAWAKHFPG